MRSALQRHLVLGRVFLATGALLLMNAVAPVWAFDNACSGCRTLSNLKCGVYTLNAISGCCGSGSGEAECNGSTFTVECNGGGSCECDQNGDNCEGTLNQ